MNDSSLRPTASASFSARVVVRWKTMYIAEEVWTERRPQYHPAWGTSSGRVGLSVDYEEFGARMTRRPVAAEDAGATGEAEYVGIFT